MDSVLIENIHMHIPDTDIYIYVGDICKVPKLGTENFMAWYGWYTPIRSMPVYGWFFISESDSSVHSVRFEYFDGIEVVEHHEPSGGSSVMPYQSGAAYSSGQLVYLTAGAVYQASQDFTASDTGTASDDLAADVASGKLVPIGEIHLDSTVTENSTNGVTSSGIYSFVNSSVGTNTAYFIGTFNSVQELEAYTGDLLNNDYAFVVSTDASGNTVYNRYKYNANTQLWEFEYSLNNSSFTANQWNSINSGITASDVTKLSGIETGANKTIVDVAFNENSTNPIQNAVLTELITPITQAQYDALQTKTMPLYFIYDP